MTPIFKIVQESDVINSRDPSEFRTEKKANFHVKNGVTRLLRRDLLRYSAATVTSGETRLR